MADKKLTDLQVKSAKPLSKAYKLMDGGGLYILVTAIGSRYWRYNYRFGGKAKTLAIGVYPKITLTAARAARNAARSLLDSGIDPVLHRQQERKRTASAQIAQAEQATAEANKQITVAEVAREWHSVQKPLWIPKHAARVLRIIEQDIAPQIGGIAIGELTANDVTACIQLLADRGTGDHAKRTLDRIRKMVGYAIAKDYVQVDPLRTIDHIFKLSVRPTQHRPALPLERLTEFWDRLENANCQTITRLALNLLMVTMLRPGELREGRWNEIDGDTWTIPGHRLKIKKRKGQSGEDAASPHIVPLSRQALEILNQLRTISGHVDLMFPSSRNANQPITDNSLVYFMHRIGYKNIATPHGFRALASTTLYESKLWSGDAIELQQTHIDSNAVRRAYNRSRRLDERREMMQWLADLYYSKKPGLNVVPIKTRR